MTIKYYTSKLERIIEIKNATKRNESLIHDDFTDKNNKTTNGNSRKLTFAIIPKPDDIKFQRKKELQKKLDDNTINFEELKEYLRD